MRKQVDKLDKQTQLAEAKTEPKKGCTWQCSTCDEVFKTYAATERHDVTHRRIECVFSTVGRYLGQLCEPTET